MPASSIYLIATVEVAAVLLLLCAFLLFQNHSLKKILKKLQNRMEQLVIDLRAARASSTEPPQSAEKNDSSSYKQQLNKQIELTREHHATLGPAHDIALDIDPETPLPRRVAAMRYALLQAEKEATANRPNDLADWLALQNRYESLFAFQAEYTPEQDNTSTSLEEMESLAQELTAAKKRINNLERFKALYFDLEEKWEACKDQAQTHIHEITQLTADTQNANAIENALNAYQATYGDLGELIEGGIEGAAIVSPSQLSNDSSHEVRHLRAVAADQHKIITELQKKLLSSTTAEAKEEVVNELQDQLQKQIRFVQESETCIQLLEDELTTAHKELEQLQSRANTLPQIKSKLKELRDQNDDYELQLSNLQAENRRLKNAAKSSNNAPPADTGDSRELKRELTELEARYAELEEKFLDLKLSQ